MWGIMVCGYISMMGDCGNHKWGMQSCVSVERCNSRSPGDARALMLADLYIPQNAEKPQGIGSKGL
jgi:hypothetical protein